MARSMLHSVGLPELVTHSLTEHEQRALQLAREPEVLGRLRERVAQQRTCPLFDATPGGCGGNDPADQVDHTPDR
jgi:protein O-GlcNAc transferase